MEKTVVNEVRNSQGQPIVLNEAETEICRINQAKVSELKNALGYEIPMTTLTAIQKRVLEQKFFTVAPSLYIPVTVGNGAFASNLLTFTQSATAGDFEHGIINTGANNSRLAEADASVDSITVPIVNWAKAIHWSLFDVAQAARAGNWNIIEAKERARKKNWDLGIQQIAFYGTADGINRGLLNQTNVTVNTTLITKYISTMTATEFQTFLRGLVGAYHVNSLYTANPNRFVIPQIDFDGLATAVDETYPLKSRLERIEESLKRITGNPDFKVMGLPYADVSRNVNVPGLNKNVYTLYNADEDSLRMEIPVDYTNTIQSTINGFQFSNVGYGQFTQTKAYRPLEMLYFTF